MKERPIRFFAPEVRAILAGTKTQTRRIVKPQPTLMQQGWLWVSKKLLAGHAHTDASALARLMSPHCPYGSPGDRLWGREAFRGPYAYEVNKYPLAEWGNKPVWYCADGNPPKKFERQFWPKSRPSIHMPRRFSRITLEVTEVRVERLQDISEADAQAEGAPSADLVSGRECIFPHQGTHRWGFQLLWESIHPPVVPLLDADGRRVGTQPNPARWDANPWVWVVGFRKAGGEG